MSELRLWPLSWLKRLTVRWAPSFDIVAVFDRVDFESLFRYGIVIGAQDSCHFGLSPNLQGVGRHGTNPTNADNQHSRFSLGHFGVSDVDVINRGIENDARHNGISQLNQIFLNCVGDCLILSSCFFLAFKTTLH